jgi:hypothetical protein
MYENQPDFAALNLVTYEFVRLMSQGTLRDAMVWI